MQTPQETVADLRSQVSKLNQANLDLQQKIKQLEDDKIQLALDAKEQKNLYLNRAIAVENKYKERLKFMVNDIKSKFETYKLVEKRYVSFKFRCMDLNNNKSSLSFCSF